MLQHITAIPWGSRPLVSRRSLHYARPVLARTPSSNIFRRTFAIPRNWQWPGPSQSILGKRFGLISQTTVNRTASLLSLRHINQDYYCLRKFSQLSCVQQQSPPLSQDINGSGEAEAVAKMAVQLEGRDLEGLVTTLRALLRSETKLGIETYNFLLGVSNQLRDAQLTTTIFQRLIHSGCTPTIETYDHYIAAVASNNLEKAFSILQEMQNRFGEATITTLNGMVGACIKSGTDVPAALAIINAIKNKRFGKSALPDSQTYAFALQAFARQKNLKGTKKLWEEIQDMQVELTAPIISSLMEALCSCNAHDQAFSIFSEIEKSHPQLISSSDIQNRHIWHQLVKGCAELGDIEKCLKYLKKMEKCGFTLRTEDLSFVMKAYSRSSLFSYEAGLIENFISYLKRRAQEKINPVKKEDEGTDQEHEKRENHIEGEGNEEDPLLNILLSNQKGSQQSSVLQPTLGDFSPSPGDVALNFLDAIKKERLLGGMDVTLYNYTLYALIRSGEMDKAVQLVNSMQEQGIAPDIYTHSTIIQGYGLQGNYTQAVAYYNEMLKNGVRPDKRVFNALLRAKSEAIRSELVPLQGAPLFHRERYNTYDKPKDEIKHAYSELLKEMQKQGVKNDIKFFHNLVFGLCVSGLFDLAYPVVQSMIKGEIIGTEPGNLSTKEVQLLPDRKMYSILLYGIALRPYPSQELTNQVLAMMEQSKIAPNNYIYSTLMNIYSNGVGGVRKDESFMPIIELIYKNYLYGEENVRKSPEQEEARLRNHTKDIEERRESFLKVLKLYNIMKAENPNGVPDAAYTILTRLVGLDRELGFTHADVDPSLNSLPSADPPRSFRSAFLPPSLSEQGMTPIEYLIWKDMQASGGKPDRIIFNSLISQLLVSKELKRAEKYFYFVLDQWRSMNGADSLSSGVDSSSNWLKRDLKLKYRSIVLKQKQIKKDQINKLIELTKQFESSHSEGVEEEKEKEEKEEAVEEEPQRSLQTALDGVTREEEDEVESYERSVERYFTQSKAHLRPDPHIEAHPLFMKTLYNLGIAYLGEKQFDKFVFVYTLAKSSYPTSSSKCFGYLIGLWLDQEKNKKHEGLLSAAIREHKLEKDLNLNRIKMIAKLNKEARMNKVLTFEELFAPPPPPKSGRWSV